MRITWFCYTTALLPLCVKVIINLYGTWTWTSYPIDEKQNDSLCMNARRTWGEYCKYQTICIQTCGDEFSLIYIAIVLYEICSYHIPLTINRKLASTHRKCMAPFIELSSLDRDERNIARVHIDRYGMIFWQKIRDITFEIINSSEKYSEKKKCFALWGVMGSMRGY